MSRRPWTEADRQRLANFTRALEELCIAHAVRIAHEDSHGAGLLEPLPHPGDAACYIDFHLDEVDRI